MQAISYAATMERMTWTDERLEERFNGIDRRFDEVDRRFDSVDRRFEQVDRRFDRVEGEIVELRHGIGGLQTTLNRIGGSMIVGLIGIIAAVLLKGG
jgi:DNA anti-recombination protein RmuC